MFAFIMKLSSFPSKKDENKMLHIADLSDGSSVFLSEDEKDTYKVGQAVGIYSKKYQTNGEWKTSRSLVPMDAMKNMIAGL